MEWYSFLFMVNSFSNNRFIIYISICFYILSWFLYYVCIMCYNMPSETIFKFQSKSPFIISMEIINSSLCISIHFYCFDGCLFLHVSRVNWKRMKHCRLRSLIYLSNINDSDTISHTCFLNWVYIWSCTWNI